MSFLFKKKNLSQEHTKIIEKLLNLGAKLTNFRHDLEKINNFLKNVEKFKEKLLFSFHAFTFYQTEKKEFEKNIRFSNDNKEKFQIISKFKTNLQTFSNPNKKTNNLSIEKPMNMSELSETLKFVTEDIQKKYAEYEKMQLLEQIFDEEYNFIQKYLKPIEENEIYLKEIRKTFANLGKESCNHLQNSPENLENDDNCSDFIKKKICVEKSLTKNTLDSLNKYGNGSKIFKNQGLIGLNNLGNTCYFNSTVQSLIHLHTFYEIFITQKSENCLEQKEFILKTDFTNLMNQVWLSEKSKCINPSFLWKKIGILNEKVNLLFAVFVINLNYDI